MGNSSLKKKSKFLNASPIWPGIQRHLNMSPPLHYPSLILWKPILPASFSPVPIVFIHSWCAVSALHPQTLGCLCFWFSNPAVHLNETYWFIHNWSWIKEIRLQFCSLSSVLWWWLKGKKGRKLTIALFIIRKYWN